MTNDKALVERLREMPSSLNDALRKLDIATNEIERQAQIIAEKDAEIERLQESLRKAGRAAEYANDCFVEASAKINSAEAERDAAVEAEREACAEIADRTAIEADRFGLQAFNEGADETVHHVSERADAYREIATAIRSRAAGGGK